MIQIGKYRFGFASFSMMVVFAVLSVCAIAAAFLKPADWQTRLSEIPSESESEPLDSARFQRRCPW